MSEMNYNNEGVRRQDRLLDHDRAVQLLQTAEYGVLSMSDAQGTPYGIPVNYVWDGASSIYIHCAPTGRKLNILHDNSRVSFCVVGNTCLLPSRFTTEYESIVLTATAHCDLPEQERRDALKLLLSKLSPNDMQVGLMYAEKSFHRVQIIRLDVTTWSGKCKRVKHNNDNPPQPQQ